jgi:phage terminase small subunit
MAEKKPRPLTPQQEAFCLEYCQSGNAAEAYRAAYPRSKAWKPEALWSQASRTLADPKVAARVHELQAKARALSDEQFEFGVTEILREAVGIACSDLAELVDDDDNVLPVKQWPKRVRRAVASLKIKPEYRTTEDGREFIGYSKEVKFWDKNSALDKLMRINGMFEKDNEQKNPFDGLPRATLRELERVLSAFNDAEPGAAGSLSEHDASATPGLTH